MAGAKGNAPPKQYDLMAFHEYMHFLKVEMKRRMDDAEIVVTCMRDEAVEGTMTGEKKDMYRALYARAKEEKENVVNEYVRFPRVYANKSIHDEYDMTCEIIECTQLCHVCNSVSHSFSKCKPRRCPVCGSRMHLHANCSIKNQCKTRPVHTKMVCPHENMILPELSALFWIQNHQIKKRRRLLRAASGESRDDVGDDFDASFYFPFGMSVEVM